MYAPLYNLNHRYHPQVTTIISMTGKRPLALREGGQTTKKAKYTYATVENDSLDGEAVESLGGQLRFSPIHGTDINQDWPLVDVDSADTQKPFSICTGFTNEHDQLAHRRIPVAGGVGAATPNILPQSSEGAGGITISVTTSGAVTSRPTTPFAAYDACFGLVLYEWRYLSCFRMTLTSPALFASDSLRHCQCARGMHPRFTKVWGKSGADIFRRREEAYCHNSF